jgi:hypothetical protein
LPDHPDHAADDQGEQHHLDMAGVSRGFDQVDLDRLAHGTNDRSRHPRVVGGLRPPHHE